MPLARTALYQNHVAQGARMVPFGGWEMPVQYSSILAEARAVRSKAGLFDVSHMGRLYISGADAPSILERLLTASVFDLRPGRARYSMLCDQDGGIIDDVVLFNLGHGLYLLVCNAGNRPQVVEWMKDWAERLSTKWALDDRTEETVMLAFQGPATPALLDEISWASPVKMRPFSAIDTVVAGKKVLLGRTGYTGEDGFELVMKASDGPAMFDYLLAMGALPCGLGARDVLRLEAGLPLHGQDIDPTTTPIEAGLERFVRLDKDFVGAEVLRRQQQEGTSRHLVGLKVQGRAVPRHGYSVSYQGQTVGAVTSGTFSPTLDGNIAMAYVMPDCASPDQLLDVDIRGTPAQAQVVSLPFYSRKKAT